MIEIKDEFLSEEDLDLKNMSIEERFSLWDMWFRQVQATNERDAHTYSHGVFTVEPSEDDSPGLVDMC